MRRKMKCWVIGGVVLLIVVITGYGVFNRFRQQPVHTLPAKIEEIKQAVKLSTLDITAEEIFKDTVHIKSVVYRSKARVYIRFDIENIPVREQGDTLIVQLPPEIIDVYEVPSGGFRILDVWNIYFPEEPVDTPLTNAEENRIKGKLIRRIENQMYEKGYVKRARENALHSLAGLFSLFREHVVIVDEHPDGWKRDEEISGLDTKPEAVITIDK